MTWQRAHSIQEMIPDGKLLFIPEKRGQRGRCLHEEIEFRKNGSQLFFSLHGEQEKMGLDNSVRELEQKYKFPSFVDAQTPKGVPKEVCAHWFDF